MSERMSLTEICCDATVAVTFARVRIAGRVTKPELIQLLTDPGLAAELTRRRIQPREHVGVLTEWLDEHRFRNRARNYVYHLDAEESAEAKRQAKREWWQRHHGAGAQVA